MTTGKQTNDGGLAGPRRAAPVRDGCGSLLKIGDLSRRLDLTTRTLRYWEELGLLPPTRRTDGGLRVYGEEHVRAARGIVRLKHAGFSLDAITHMQRGMKETRTALEGMTSIAASLAEREQEIRAHIREQEILLEELASARRCAGLCDGCHGKVFDSECIACLSEASGHTMPDCLRSVLEAASSSLQGGSST